MDLLSASPPQQYVASVFFVITTMTTIGYGGNMLFKKSVLRLA